MQDSPIQLMRFESAFKHDPAVDRWFETQTLNLGNIALLWFDLMRNLGFFLGAWLEDPAGLLEGTGKRMRHVKMRPGQEPNAAVLAALVENAYRDMRERRLAGAL